jgi:glyoxylase I family protein
MDQNNGAAYSYGFHHLALWVRDIEKSKSFYKDVLGFKEVIRFPHPWDANVRQIVMMDVGDGNCLEMFSDAPKGTIPNGAYFHVAFRTDDVDALFKRVKAAGTTVISAPKDVLLQGDVPTTVRVAFFEGPDGEQLEFCQQIDGINL